MADTITLDILTPTGARREGVSVPGVEVPGLLGEMGVLPGHETFITAVIPGVVRFREGTRSTRIAVGAGFLEITDDGRVVVLVDRAREPAQIDAADTRSRLSKVSSQLAAHRGAVTSAEHRTLVQEQAWLEAQLRASGPHA